jgi:hypothetical protein
MSAIRIAAIVLIAAGILGLVFDGFRSKGTHEAKIGPLELSVREKENVSVPDVGGRRGDRDWRNPADRPQDRFQPSGLMSSRRICLTIRLRPN